MMERGITPATGMATTVRLPTSHAWDKNHDRNRDYNRDHHDH